jgi:hypothetical protein
VKTSQQKQQERLIRQLASFPFQPMELVPGAAEAIRHTALPGLPAGTASPAVLAIHAGWRYNLYAVWVSTVQTAWGLVDHLWIRRHDGQPVRSWTDCQRIKREVLLTGAERAAVEVYPPESELVDSANMYHLWVLPLGFRLPFTLKD